MKLRTQRKLHPQQGSAVIVMMALLALMLLYVGANLKTLHFVSRELKLIEKHQLRRVATTTAPSAAGFQVPLRPQSSTNTVTASY